MQCQEFNELAPQWLEGVREAAAAAHLDQCARCRAMIADLEAIGQAAPQLAEAEPPERIWAALRNQLEAEGLIRQEQAAPAGRSWWFAAWPRPALAGAYLALLMVVTGLVVLRGPAPNGSDFLAGVVASTVPHELRSQDEASLVPIGERLPEVSDAYQKNLQIVDNFIALCEKTVRDEPANDLAREYLLSAYQQKADLLAMLTERGARGD